LHNEVLLAVKVSAGKNLCDFHRREICASNDCNCHEQRDRKNDETYAMPQ